MTNFEKEQAGNLRYIVLRLHRRLRDESSRLSPLTFSEETVLAQLLAAPRQTGAELARFQRMTPQSMNKIVASLLGRGYIATGKNTQDKRRKELFLTGKGTQLITAISTERENWIMSRVGEALEPHEAQQLADSLPLLRRLADRERRYQTLAEDSSNSENEVEE